MKTSDAGVSLIKKHEGLRLQAYADPAHGWAVPTIGYGHTSAAGAPMVTRGMSITAAEADAILRRDLGQFEQAIMDLVKVPLTQNQFDALVSFTFNLGAGNLRSSTLLKKLNAGDYVGAAFEFPKWNKAGGKVLPGLVKRRADESDLFISGQDPVRELQAELGVAADGIWGPKSQAALGAFKAKTKRVELLEKEL